MIIIRIVNRIINFLKEKRNTLQSLVLAIIFMYIHFYLHHHHHHNQRPPLLLYLCVHVASSNGVTAPALTDGEQEGWREGRGQGDVVWCLGERK